MEKATRTPFPTRSASGSNSPSTSSALLEANSPPRSPGFVPPFARRTPSAQSSYTESPYGGPRPRSQVLSVVDKWSLGPDPRLWGAELGYDTVEDDDELHQPEKKRAMLDRNGGMLSFRGIANLGCVFLLIIVLLGLFAGYPVARWFLNEAQKKNGAFNVGGTNSTGQVPVSMGGRGLIDQDTPEWAYTKDSWNGRGEFELVFSDEFNTDGRTFYPGDDPYWEAVDLQYWATGDREWYDPKAVTTSGGSLTLTFTADPENGMNFTSGMIQGWNKFCFTGGLVEAKVMMPGWSNLMGMWPALWTMGNLGRAGYGSTTHGMWPYSYDSCDVGTVPNQTWNGLPPQATSGNDKYNNGLLSFQVGQRLSRCTCEGDAHLHPGPRHPDGTFVGRSAPEIDMFEQQVGLVQKGVGEVSQSLQIAPFNLKYDWQSLTDNSTWGVVNPNITKENSYIGGVYQQAGSYVTQVDQNCFEKDAQCYSLYGFEYKPGFDDGYIQWISNNKTSWHITSAAIGGDLVAGIGPRSIPQEPMYLIMNLGQSTSFTYDISSSIHYPVTMYVDYIRVYQPKGQTNVGCDPKGFPTAKYIEQHIEAYTNPNLTQWSTTVNGSYRQPMPRNSFMNQC